MGIQNNPLSKHRHSAAGSRGVRFSIAMSRGFCAALMLSLIWVAAPAPVGAAELGRLFLTPQQRQDLDRRRASNRVEEEVPQIKEGPLTLEGHVQRSSGKTATWINGVPQYDSHAGPDPARVTVVPNAGQPGVSLKVGEIYERSSGEVRDSLQGGEINVRKPSSQKQPATTRKSAPKSPAPSR
jgi:hypothetical protein